MKNVAPSLVQNGEYRIVTWVACDFKDFFTWISTLVLKIEVISGK